MKFLTELLRGLCCLGLVLSLLPVLPACGPDMEQENFKLTLKYPDGEEEDLGIVTGLTECNAAAAARAEEAKLAEGEWSFTCCHMTPEDECAKKIS